MFAMADTSDQDEIPLSFGCRCVIAYCASNRFYAEDHERSPMPLVVTCTLYRSTGEQLRCPGSLLGSCADLERGPIVSMISPATNCARSLLALCFPRLRRSPAGRAPHDNQRRSALRQPPEQAARRSPCGKVRYVLASLLALVIVSASPLPAHAGTENWVSITCTPNGDFVQLIWKSWGLGYPSRIEVRAKVEIFRGDFYYTRSSDPVYTTQSGRWSVGTHTHPTAQPPMNYSAHLTVYNNRTNQILGTAHDLSC
jgi:hypothetical protein